MRALCAVIDSAWSQASRTLSETAPRSPTMRMRTPSSASFIRYLDTATSTRPIRPETSSALRFQFSLENANTVRYSMPRSAQARTVRTSASTPCLWPKKRGMKRRLAQRPLPSMTIATWRGVLGSRCKRSDREDLGFLGLHEAVDLGDHAVGQALHLVLGAALLVLGGFLVLQLLLQV